MANKEHLKIIEQGVAVWNEWREKNPTIKPDLRRAYLSGADLSNFNLSNANLNEANLMEADLRQANLSGAYLCRTLLWNARLYKTDLSEAKLIEANLTKANLVSTNFEKANLTGCKIYGISAWDLKLQGTVQLDLIITPHGVPAITADNLEVAQFIYLLLNNKKLRDIIDTIGKKAVLILGRFIPERKAVLDAIREELRRLNYVPIVFDFEKPKDRDFTETIMTLAGMCLFVIVDITNPKSSPLELQATVPDYRIPFVPIIQEGEKPFSMFKDIQQKFDWVLPLLEYDTESNLIKVLEKAVINPALNKHDELIARKAQGLKTRHIKDYL